MKTRAKVVIGALASVGFALLQSQSAGAGNFMEVLETRPIENYDPFTVRGMESHRLMGLLFAPMVELNADGQPENRLADSVVVSGHGWNVHLHTEACFADGHLAPAGSVNYEPVTAQDVVATYKALVDPATVPEDPSMRNILIKYVQDMRVTGRSTLRVDIRRGFSLFPIVLTFPVVPAKVLTPGAARPQSDFIKQPYGAGYFYSKRHEPTKTYWDLVRNPKLPLADTARIEEIKYRYKTNYDSDINDICVGYEYPVCIPDVPAEKIAKLDGFQASGGFKMQWLTGLRYNYVAFNLKNDILKDVRVRQALACAIDREQLLGEFLGQGKPVNGPFPADAANRCDTCVIACQLSDTVLANRLLDQAGWKRQQSDYRWNGQRALEIRLTTFADTRSVANAVAVRIAGYWKQIGVRTSVENLTWGQYVNDVFTQESFDAAYGGWSFALKADPGHAFHSKGSGNFISYSNPSVDAALDTIAAVGWDTDRSLRLYTRVHRLIGDDAPYAFLFSINRWALLSNSIEYGPYIEPFQFLRRVNKWTIQN